MNADADHFSAVAGAYAECRPTYPAVLFDYLASLPARRELAWDCGAGSGQATVSLASRFRRVVATDISAAQLSAAPARGTVEYRVAGAGESGLLPQAVDLVTVAQALHWFEVDAFYGEVDRVLHPTGWIAVWSYGLQRTDDAALDGMLLRFYYDVLGPWWPAERRHVDQGYRTLPFPFREIEPPAFSMETPWTAAQLLGYIRTWSAVSAFRSARGIDPVDALAPRLERAWGRDSRLIRWPLTVRVGRR